MKLIEIQDQKLWDGFVSSQPWGSFQQSWAWGDFQKTQGHLVRRFFLEDDVRVLLAAQLIHYKRRFSGYWFMPRGPVLADVEKKNAREMLAAFFGHLLKHGLPDSALFYRCEPPLELLEAEGAMPMLMRRNHAMSPASTVLIDLKKSEEALLADMHPKTRYNIRVAEKHGVSVREGSDEKDFDEFSRLLSETAERDEFTAHGSSYLRAMYEFLAPRGMARMRLAEKNGKALAANLEIAYGDTLTYLHGGSSSEARNVMAPYLLHWNAIQAAKREGFTFYDLWGCNPDAKSSYYYKPSWEGITRFKRGWGGRLVNLVGTWDLPMNRILYRLAFPQGLFRG